MKKISFGSSFLPLFIVLLMVISLILPIGSAGAFDPKILDNPYNESIGVVIEKGTSQNITEAAKQQAIYEAFKRVLQKNLQKKYSTDIVDKYSNNILNFIDSVKVLKEIDEGSNYKAEYVVMFREKAINKILESENNISFISKIRTLVVPVFYIKGEPIIWGDNNLWMLSWEQVLREGEGKNVILPIGDLEDVRDLKMLDIVNGDVKRLEKFMNKYNAHKLIISEAIFDKDYLEVITKKYSFDAGEYKSNRNSKHYNFSKATVSNTSLKKDFLYAIASDVIVKIGEEKEVKYLVNNNIESIEVSYKIQGMKDYLKLRKEIGKLKFVKEVDFLEMSSQNANIILYYKGGMAGFISYLYRNGIKLHDIDGQWNISFL